MKTKITSVILLTLVAILLFCSLAACNEEEDSDKPYATTQDYTYKTDVAPVASILNTTDDAYLVLANKSVVVGQDYVPKNLTLINSKYTRNGKELYLEGYAAKAAEALVKEMTAHGYEVFITSAYRSYEYQQTLYNTYFEQEKAKHPNWTDEQIKQEVLTYSAYPGTSEHQTGLCVDLITNEMEGLWNYGSETPNNPYDKGFAETSAYTWLLENAHKFGFILRYPEDKTNITGYSYESWHYRFVGVSAATEIYEKGITLEEYLDK